MAKELPDKGRYFQKERTDTMKKRVYSILLAVVLVFAAAPAAPITAKAETNVNTYQTAETLTGLVSGELERGSSRWYKYTMPSGGGHVHFTLTNPDANKDYRLTVYDPQVHKIKSYTYSNSTETTEFAFAPGTMIYLKVESEIWGDKKSTSYSLEASYLSASDWENDYTNDEMSGADTLTDGKTRYGVIITGDDEDWYVFQMPSDGKVTFTLENTNSVNGAEWRIKVYDSLKQKKENTQNSSSDYSITTDAVRESAGKNVYVCVSRDWANAGGVTYQITPQFTADDNSSSNTNNQSTDDNQNSDAVPVPSKVGGLKVSNIKGARIRVSFNGDDDADGYQISYTYGGETRTKDVSGTSTKLHVSKGKKVSVKVRAYNYDDNDQKQYGTWSGTKTLKTDKK